jgi:hypothetical protein
MKIIKMSQVYSEYGQNRTFEKREAIAARYFLYLSPRIKEYFLYPKTATLSDERFLATYSLTRDEANLQGFSALSSRIVSNIEILECAYEELIQQALKIISANFNTHFYQEYDTLRIYDNGIPVLKIENIFKDDSGRSFTFDIGSYYAHIKEEFIRVTSMSSRLSGSSESSPLLLCYGTVVLSALILGMMYLHK